MKKGLVIIDVQGELARQVLGAQTLIANLQTLLKAARILRLDTVWCEQNPAGLGDTIAELQPYIKQQPIVKNSFDACAEPAFVSATDPIEHWYVCGIEAHVCVWQTVKGLLALNKRVELLVDGISSRRSLDRSTGIDKACRAGAWPCTLEMALFEWLGDAKREEFKTVLPLIKQLKASEAFS